MASNYSFTQVTDSITDHSSVRT